MRSSVFYIRFLHGIFLTGLVLMLSTCRKEAAVRIFPRTLTEEVTDISSEGVTFHGRIVTLGSEPITDHGFIFRDYFVVNMKSGTVISLGPADTPGPFEAKCTTGLQLPVTYYVRSFVKTKTYTVLGQALSFSNPGSPPPVITGLSSLEGTWNDTLTVYGTNFFHSEEYVKVYFDTIRSRILEVTDTSLTTIVPLKLLKKEWTISVTIIGQNATFKDKFSLLEPLVEKVTPDSAFYKNTCNIFGKNFHPDVSQVEVFIGNQPCHITSSSPTKISFTVPSGLHEGRYSIRLNIAGFTVIREDMFYYSAPFFSMVSPQKGTFLDMVEIHGQNFHSEITRRKVTFSNTQATIISYTDTLIRVRVPGMLNKDSSEISLIIDDLKYPTGFLFCLSPPEIITVTPDTSFYNGTLTITGHNFNPQMYGNLVYLGKQSVSISAGNKEVLQVRIPERIETEDGKLTVTVSVAGMSATWDSVVIIPRPVIDHFYPDSGIAGENMTIYGNYFHDINKYNTVRMDGIAGETTYSSRKMIRYTIPGSAPVTSSLTVETYKQKSNSVVLPLKKIRVTGVSPTTFHRGDEITITGANFCSYTYNGRKVNKVLLSLLPDPLALTSFSHTFLKVQIPDREMEEGPVTLEVRVGVQNIILEDALTYQELWQKKTTLDIGSNTSNFACTTIGAKAYLGIALDNNNFWKYDPETNLLTELSPFPIEGPQIIDAAAFSVGDTIYVYSNISDSATNPSGKTFYSYNTRTDRWTAMDNFPDLPPFLTAFTIGNRAFAGMGHLGFTNFRDFWEYDASTNQWSRKTDYPGSLFSGFEPVSFVINSLGYVVTNRGEMWCYNPSNDTWIKKRDCPFPESLGREGMVAFAAHEKGYVALGVSLSDGVILKDLWEYNPYTDEWSEKPHSFTAISSGFSFSWDNKGYIGGGITTDRIPNRILFEIDPQ